MKINVPDFKKKVTISYQSLSIIPEGNTIIFHFPLSTFNSSPSYVKSTSMLFFYCVQCQRVLGLIQLGVDAAGLQQLPMGAALGNYTVGNGHDAAGTADGTQAVSDNQRRPSLGEVIKGPMDFRLRHGVQCGGGFVQNQNGRILQENPGDGDALLLPAG